MNRLEKKCLFGSAAMHVLLVVVFLFGAAFLPKRLKNEAPQVIEIVPYDALAKVTDGPSKGGNPNVIPPSAPAPVRPPPPPVQPPSPPPPRPAPEKLEEPVKPEKVTPPKARDLKQVGDDPEPVKKAPSRDLSRLTNSVVKTKSADLAKARAQREAREKFEREQAKRAGQLQALAGAFSQAEAGLSRGLSGKVVSSVEMAGPGGGGPAMINWRSAVADIYTRAWDPPQDAQDSAKVATKITIARDGTVLNGRITRPSGDSALDRSVERVLREVKTVPAFPEEAKEEQRTLNFIFDLTVKRSL